MQATPAIVHTHHRPPESRKATPKTTGDAGYELHCHRMPPNTREQYIDTKNDDRNRLRPLSSPHAADRLEKDSDAVQPPLSNHDSRWIEQ